MAKRIFISYCHKQGDWVWDDLKPVLAAGGAEVLIDRERFVAGKTVAGQMDATQDRAEMSVLVLSPDYLASDYCRHEMQRALARDPDFQNGLTIPIVREQCTLPAAIINPNPLYVDLQNDKIPEQWHLLLQACAADLGCDAPHWLHVRNEVARFLRDGQCVNLVVHGKPQWRALLDHLLKERLPDMGEVNVASGRTATRRGLVAEMLRASGATVAVPAEPDDLACLEETLEARLLTRLLFTNFDMVARRDYRNKDDLFSSLRHLISDRRKLVLLIQSRSYFRDLIPADHPLSSITTLKTVELRGRT